MKENKTDNKKYKMLLEIVAKEETPMGAIGIKESISLCKNFGDLAKKMGFDCYVKGIPKDKLNYNPTGKEYKLKTLDDIHENLTMEQFEFFIDDLRSYVQTMQNIKTASDLFGIDIKQEENGMLWLDTGLNEKKITIKTKSSNKL